MLINRLTESNLIELVCINNNDLLSRTIWQKYIFAKLAKEKCDVIFAPGGIFINNFRPYVTMFHNMQVFDKNARQLEGISFLRLKFFLLRYFQGYSFSNANGLIFLSNHAKDYLHTNYNRIAIKTKNTLIPHGVDENNIIIQNKKYNNHNSYTPLKILYVSTVKSYKHQWNLIDAISLLIKKGYNVELHLIGDGDYKFISRMKKSIAKVNNNEKRVFYHGKMEHEELKKYYKSADIFAYVSSCENLPIIVLEAMSYGLPIASSNLRPMTDIMGESALYFDHNDINSIEHTIEELINNVELRKKISYELFNKSKIYSWPVCADLTFSFISTIAKDYHC